MLHYRAGMTVAASGQTLLLHDGRPLGYGEYGKPDGERGFYFHGHPRSRLGAWQGRADVLVPPAMGRYLAAQIPDCHATFFPEDGHLLFDYMSEIARAFAS
jgi:hypothetical protein